MSSQLRLDKKSKSSLTIISEHELVTQIRSMASICRSHGLHRSTVLNAANSGNFPCARVGRDYVVYFPAFERWFTKIYSGKQSHNQIER